MPASSKDQTQASYITCAMGAEIFRGKIVPAQNAPFQRGCETTSTSFSTRERFSGETHMPQDFSGSVNVFRDRQLPETAVPAGYAALIHA
jgi:hypothetical protein